MQARASRCEDGNGIVQHYAKNTKPEVVQNRSEVVVSRQTQEEVEASDLLELSRSGSVSSYIASVTLYGKVQNPSRLQAGEARPRPLLE